MADDFFLLLDYLLEYELVVYRDGVYCFEDFGLEDGEGKGAPAGPEFVEEVDLDAEGLVVLAARA